jgi:hypothetical protein
MAKKLGCYVGIHRFERKTVDGKWYKDCADCGRQIELRRASLVRRVLGPPVWRGPWEKDAPWKNDRAEP